MRYVERYVPGRRFNALEHRVVWEKAHGPIPPGMVVHHKNHDKRDNRLENLELMSRAEHARHHLDVTRLHAGRHAKVAHRCAECGTDFQARADARFCSHACKLRYWRAAKKRAA